MIDQLVRRIASTEGCTIFPTTGQPSASLLIPDDLHRFYTLCGGAVLFENSMYPLLISPPDQLISANEVIVGELSGDDPSDNWYVVAKSGEEQLVSIDMNPEKLGRCYDSFWDRHAVVGSCSVVALSFSEFLRRALEAGGAELYWLSSNFTPLGDAYD
jgi:hypothetical protein